LNIARALPFQANLPVEIWDECVLVATYLINRTPSSILDGKTSYEILFNVKPSYEHIILFGSYVMFIITKSLRSNLEIVVSDVFLLGIHMKKKG